MELTFLHLLEHITQALQAFNSDLSFDQASSSVFESLDCLKAVAYSAAHNLDLFGNERPRLCPHNWRHIIAGNSYAYKCSLHSEQTDCLIICCLTARTNHNRSRSLAVRSCSLDIFSELIGPSLVSLVLIDVKEQFTATFLCNTSLVTRIDTLAQVLVCRQQVNKHQVGRWYYLRSS